MREEKLAVQVSAGVQSMSQIGIFVVQAVIRPGVEPEAVSARVEAILADLLANGPTEAPVTGTRGPMPQVGGVDDLAFPDVTRSRLSNGIELVYAHRTAVPVTRVLMSFDAGAAADPAGKLGTQSLTLSLLREGTTSRNSTQIAEASERLGASLGQGASPDRTFLTTSAPSPNLGGALDLFADVVRNPAFAPAEVERLRASLLTSIAAEQVDPAGLANRAMPTLLYGTAHPYAKLAAGSGDADAVRGLTRDELVAFHQAWIRPEKAKIFVVSDLPLDEVRAALEARFGSWQGTGAAGSKAFATTPQAATPQILLIDRPNSPQSIILAGQMTGLDPQSELLVLQTANQVLGSGFLWRINMELRENKHWSYGASGGFNWLEHAVPYMINAPVQADRTGDSIRAIQQQVGAFLSTSGVTPAELTREINGTTRELAGRYETSSAVLSAMLQNDVWRRPDDFYDTVAQRYRTLTVAQLDSAMRATLAPDRFVWVVVGDAAVVKPQLDALGLPVEVRPAAPVAPPAGS